MHIHHSTQSCCLKLHISNLCTTRNESVSNMKIKSTSYERFKYPFSQVEGDSNL
jgi:hypothetical protein